MATYIIKGFPLSSINVVSGTTELSTIGDQFRIDPTWDADTDANTYTIDDDDASVGGDFNANEIGSDSTQSAVITDGSGSTVASGQIYFEGGRTLVDEFGNTVNIYQVEIAGSQYGWIADGPLQPGNTYTITSSFNVIDSNEPAYTSLYSQTYDPDAANSITGTSAADSLSGGDDADSFIVSDGFGADTIEGGEGGTDEDTIDASGLTGPVTVIYSGDEVGTLTDGSDTLTFSEIEALVLTDSDDVVRGEADSAGLDIDAGEGSDSVRGGAGDDSLLGRGGSDTVSGDGGSDTIAGGSSADTLVGGTGGDSIMGGTGDDVIRGDTMFFDPVDYAATVGNATNLTVTNSADGPIELWFIDNTGTPVFYSTLNAGETIVQPTYETHNWILRDEDGNYLELIVGAADQSINYGADGLDDTLSGGRGADQIFGDFGNDIIDGGQENDILSGGTGDDTFVYEVGDGADTIIDFNTGNTGTLSDGDSTNNDFLDLSSFYDNLSELYADLADGALDQSVTTDAKGRTIDWTNNDSFGAGSLAFTGASADNSSFTQENTGVVCFTSGTAIRTPNGDVLIDDLKVGDLVTTMDNGPQKIRWIGTTSFGAQALRDIPRLRPVLFKRGILGAERDLLVSRQHAMLIGDELVRAIHLTDCPGVRIAHGKRSVTYYHLMFERHQIIFGENTPLESFYPGPIGLKMICPRAEASLLDVFPKFRDRPTKTQVVELYGQTARSITSRRDVRW